MALTTLGWLGLQNLWLLGTLAAQRRGARALVLQAAARGLLLLGLPLLLHVLLLRLHFAHLPRSGNGDGYMSPEFQATLEGSRYAESVPFEGRPSFWAQARIRRACRVRAARVRHACGTHHACGSYRHPSSSCAQLVEHAQAQFWYNRNMAVLFPRGSHAFDTAWCDTLGASSRGASAPNPAPDPEPNPAPDPDPTSRLEPDRTWTRTQAQVQARSQAQVQARAQAWHRPQPEPEPQPGTRGRWRRGASTLTW